MKKRGSTMMVFALVACTTLFAISAQAYDLKWGTSPVGGVWGVLGNAMIEDVMRANPSWKASASPVGGAANVIGLGGGQLNIAFSFSDSANDAWEGREFFSKGKLHNIRALCSLFPEPTQFAVYADSGISTVPQLKGKKVTPGPKGSAIEVVTRRILAEYGLTYKDMNVQMIGFEDGAQLMIDNHIDAILYGAMIYPAPTLINVGSHRPIRLLSLTDEVINNMVQKYKGIIPYTLAPDSYKGVNYPVKGIAANVVILVREDMPEDVVYNITKAIATNFDRYKTFAKAMGLVKVTDMPKEAGIAFHPGALKYYKERGWIK